MHILHVVPNISITSGVMSVIMSYYRNIDRNCFSFDFLYFNDSINEFTEEIETLGGRVFKSPIPYSLGYKKFLESFFFEHKREYDIVHIHIIFLSGFFTGARKKYGVKKIICHAHATKFADRPLRAIRNRILAIQNMFAPDVYFACSNMAGKRLFGRKFKNGFVMNNAIDLEKFHPNANSRNEMRRALGVEGKFVVGHIGNWSPSKNPLFMMRIFAEIAKKEDRAVLVKAGGYDFPTNIKAECERLGILDRVIYLGNRNDVEKVVRSFDALLFPSRFEGLGIALVEAQASGVPCVFSDVVPKDANILNETNKVLSLHDSYEKWADAVLAIAQDSKKLGENEIHKKLIDAGFEIKIAAYMLATKYIRTCNNLNNA